MIEPQLETPRRAHVFPLNDSKEHVQRGEYCHCQPRVDKQADGSVVVVHNAYDGREFYE